MSRARTVAVLLVALVTVAAGGATTVAAQEDLVTLTVSVTTPSDDPVRNARLTASWDGGSTTRTTASNGRAFLDVPDDADVEISVRHDDYVRNFPLEVEDASEEEVGMTVYEKASISVTVEDSDGPVPDAPVTFRKDGRDVTTEDTGDDGVATSGTVEAGSYTIVVSKAGYYVEEETTSVSGETSETITVERGTVTLEVNVTDDHFSPPRSIEGVSVAVSDSGSVTTQPTGIGRISVPVNAWARLEATKEGYQTTERSVFVGEEDTQVDLTVQRTPAISVELLSERVVIGERVALEVTDEYGDPVSGATVRLDGDAVTETDEDGEAVVRIESGGEHEIVVEKGSLSTETKTVEGVESGEVDGTTAPGETTTEPTETSAESPGFGVLAGLVAVAILVVAALARRR